MPDLIIHILIPLTALLLFYDKKYRSYVMLLAPLAILPDFDHVITMSLHRALLHNVFILIPTIILALFFYQIRDGGDQNDAGNRMYNVAIIATFYLLSHLILDSFNGGVALFYPLSTHHYPFVFDFVFRGEDFMPVIGVDIHEPSFGFEEGVTSLGAGILLTFAVGALFSYQRNKYGDSRREPLTSWRE
jgi:hypothetical protein